MNEADAIEAVRQGLAMVLIISGPALAAATIVGLGIALFQALTQIQEMTLTFVPKIVAIMVVLMISLPFMFLQLKQYAEFLFDRIVSG
jgi:flagellar biosynthetic protein FliQ